MPIPADVYKKIVSAKVYIDENFGKPLDLDRLSREACLSRYHFHRLFTRIYQKTPHRYLTEKRIEQARQWLTGKELSITEICNYIGFESIGTFSTLFKKKMGHAPRNYRRLALRKLQLTRQQPRSFIPHCFIESCRLDESGPLPTG
jgi:AraC-like DNA-binding protein